MNFKENFLLYSILLLLILLGAASYYRFMVLHDYTISYEGDCDPETDVCFLYCEEDECFEPFYYSIIERDAGAIYEACGEDVTVCDAAYECPESDTSCSITYCDVELDGDLCETLDENI